jgi:hypothetical protein
MFLESLATRAGLAWAHLKVGRRLDLPDAPPHPATPVTRLRVRWRGGDAEDASDTLIDFDCVNQPWCATRSIGQSLFSWQHHPTQQRRALPTGLEG